jgi:hypothetical protein
MIIFDDNNSGISSISPTSILTGVRTFVALNGAVAGHAVAFVSTTNGCVGAVASIYFIGGAGVTVVGASGPTSLSAGTYYVCYGGYLPSSDSDFINLYQYANLNPLIVLANTSKKILI